MTTVGAVRLLMKGALLVIHTLQEYAAHSNTAIVIFQLIQENALSATGLA